MSILTRLGWQIRAHTATRRAPAWVSGYARAAENVTTVEDSWSSLPGAGSYALAAARYSESDLVYMCINKLSSLASGSQLVLFDPDGDRDSLTGLPLDSARIDRKDHPFYALWDRPNPFDSRSEFIEAIVVTLLLSPKGVFIHLDDGRRSKPNVDRVKRVSLKGPPRALWWILPEPMVVKPDEEKFIGGYSFSMAGERTEFATEAIMRITEFNPLNRYNSFSRVGPANLASASDIESQKAGFSIFKNGFRPSAIVESDRDQVDPDELKLMEKLWNEQQTGSENFHKLFPIWQGFKIKEFGFSPQEAESVPMAKLNRERVFGVFGVHPGLIFSSDVNLANAKVAEHATRAWTLAPMLERLAGEITSILPHWPDAPPAEAHFVGVVPADEEAVAKVEETRASAAAKRSQAVATLSSVLGPEIAVAVSQDWGILPEDMEIPSFDALPGLVEALSKAGLPNFDALGLVEALGKFGFKAGSGAVKVGSIAERNALVAAAEAPARQLAADLVSGGITLDSWLIRMRGEIQRIFRAQYRLGFGLLDQKGISELAPLLQQQFQFLNRFALEIADNPDWTAEHIGARAFQYFGASVQAYEVANVRSRLGGVGSISLPEMPADGDQDCLSRCLCGWRVVLNEAFTQASCTWVLDAEAEHCDSCLENSVKWNPLVLPIAMVP